MEAHVVDVQAVHHPPKVALGVADVRPVPAGPREGRLPRPGEDFGRRLEDDAGLKEHEPVELHGRPHLVGEAELLDGIPEGRLAGFLGGPGHGGLPLLPLRELALFSRNHQPVVPLVLELRNPTPHEGPADDRPDLGIECQNRLNDRLNGGPGRDLYLRLRR